MAMLHCAAALALRAHALVRAQVPVLRLQLARRRPNRSRSSNTSTLCSRISSIDAGAAQGRALVSDLLRRRHAEPVRARRDRTLSRGRARARGVRRRTSRSRSKPIPGTSSTAASRAIATRASIAFRSARRRSTRIICAALGRIHGSGDIARAVDEVVQRRHRQLQSRPDVRPAGADAAAGARPICDAALALEPTHISHYQLTLEPGTVFYHRPPPLPEADASWEMQLDCQERLAARGYEHYEVSAYARAGRRSRHNLNYWQFGDYIGIGAGAHGKLTWLASDERARFAIVRSARIKQPREFLRRAAAERVERSRRGRDRRSCRSSSC